MPTPQTVALHLKHFLIGGAYTPREYYVFDELKLIYMPIYKVASTSIKTALLQSESASGSAPYPQYMEIHRETSYGHHSVLNVKQRGYFSFAFVRDPFDRLISCYEDRVRRPFYAPIDRYYFDSEYNHVLIKRLFGASFSPTMSFPAFVALIARIPDYLADGHFKSQYAWLHRFGRRIPDYVGHLESLAPIGRHSRAALGLAQPSRPATPRIGATFQRTSPIRSLWRS